MWLYYRGVVKTDLVNAYKGIHSTIFFQGCSHHCKGCFNPETWDFGKNEDSFIFDENAQNEFIKVCKQPLIDAISLSGGDPLDQDLELMYQFLKRIKDEVDKPIYCWTGYTFENLINSEKSKLLEFIDYLIDGEFQEDKKEELLLRGSSNQRVIDVKESIRSNNIIKLNI